MFKEFKEKTKAAMDPMDMLIKTIATPERMQAVIEKVFTPDTVKTIAVNVDKKLQSFELEEGELRPVYTLRVNASGELKFSIITFKEKKVIVTDGEIKAEAYALVKHRTLQTLSAQEFIKQFIPETKPENNTPQ